MVRKYTHEREDWPNFKYDIERLISLLGRAHNARSRHFLP
ncbi:MAG: DUF4172 domain-containing protein [Clostridiales Family XIII bacterium]|nr:DUF4172 domain-containing protein [Clostridiales Family XIII bacterium]